MAEIYLARVTGTEKEPTKREGVFNQIIKVTPLDSIINGKDERAYSPSFMPFTEAGGGVTAIPQEGALCVVLGRTNGTHQILTYMPYDSVGPEGVYTPEEPEPNAVVLKIGGEIKSSMMLAPGGIMSFYSNPFAFIKLNGSTRNIDTNIDTTHMNYASGYENREYADEHPVTGAEKVTEYKMLFSKANEQRMFADWDLETEVANKLGIAVKYNDKILIRAGTIYNYDASISSNKEKTEVGHVYQIETRQNTLVSNEKDTINIFRLGYQFKDNLKYTADTKYPAGTMIEWASKRVDDTPATGTYSSYLMRYGKLEADTTGDEAETTKGEIYRLQMYNDVVDPIGTLITDPLGKGKGWKYEKINLLATEQYTESFGLLADKSFYRKHTHAYPGLDWVSPSTYSGLDYISILGGDYDSYEETTNWNSGKKTNAIIVSLKTGTFSFANTQYESGEKKTAESITIAKDNFEINIEVDASTSYNLKLAAGKMTIKLTADETTKIEIDKSGTVAIDSKKVRIGKSSLTLQKIIEKLLDAIKAMTLKTSQGPTIPVPINQTDFDAVKTDLQTLMDGVA